MALATVEGGASSLAGFTRLSKGLAAVFVAGYGLSLILPWTVTYLALVPGWTVPFAWNVLTAGYFEYTSLGLVSSVVGVLYFGRLLEPLWGSRGFAKFIVFVNFFTSLGTFVVSVVLYYVTSQGRFLYSPVSGFSGVIAGFVVAIKQLMPDQEFLKIKLRAKWFPSLLVVCSVIVAFLFTDAIPFVIYFILGTYISWLYLRYFQTKSEAKNVKGDSSDEFAFSTFFPQFVRPVVHPVSAFCDKLLCGRRNQGTSNSDEDEAISSRPLPGSDPIEASRRRERGARALEERLTGLNESNENHPEQNV